MACTTESERLLRSNELRVTRQRLAVLSVLRHSDQHITAADVYDRARLDAPELNASTVYRTLTQLRDLGSSHRPTSAAANAPIAGVRSVRITIWSAPHADA